MLKSLIQATLCAALIASASAYEVKPVTSEQAADYKLDPALFKKGTVTQDILIATSEGVADLAHKEAAYLLDKVMSTLKPEIAQRIRKDKVLCILVAHDEWTSEIPQFKSEKT